MQKTKLQRYIYMKVLKPTTDEQTFFFIPKEYNVSENLNFRDDQTNEVVVYTPTIVQVNDYLKVTGVFDLREGHFYDVTIGSDFDVWNENLDQWQLSPDIWNEPKRSELFAIDKIFCTAQEIDQNAHKEYSINKGEFKTQDSFSNDYIVL